MLFYYYIYTVIETMLNKVFRIIIAVSILFLSIELYHDHEEKIEGYFFCNIDCSDNEHHEINHDCSYCTHQNKIDLIKSNLSYFKFKTDKSKIHSSSDLTCSCSNYLFYNKSPPLNNLI